MEQNIKKIFIEQRPNILNAFLQGCNGNLIKNDPINNLGYLIGKKKSSLEISLNLFNILCLLNNRSENDLNIMLKSAELTSRKLNHQDFFNVNNEKKFNIIYKYLRETKFSEV